MKQSYGPTPAAIGSYISHEQTFITDADTQQFLEADERRQNAVSEAASKATVDRICRNCGQELQSVTQDICSNQRECESRASFAMPRMRAIQHDANSVEEDDESWSVRIFAQYAADPRMQLVLDSDDVDIPPRTKAPNMISVMRSLAAGVIKEADALTRERARRFCDDMHGV